MASRDKGLGDIRILITLSVIMIMQTGWANRLPALTASPQMWTSHPVMKQRIRVAKPPIFTPQVNGSANQPYATFDQSGTLSPYPAPPANPSARPPVSFYRQPLPPASSYQTPSYTPPANPNSVNPYPPNAQLPTNNQQTRFQPAAFPQSTTYPYPAGFPPGNQGGNPPVVTTQPAGQVYFPVTPMPPQVPGNQVPFVPPPDIANLDVYFPNTNSGRFTIGGTYSSDNRLLGEIVIEERNFGTPRRVREALNPNSWRGQGKNFRLEALPGQDVERYLVSLSNPYLGGTESSVSLSGYFFGRQFYDYDEQRAGGRISFGRRFNEFLTMDIGVRLESVTIDNPRVMTSPDLNAVLGNSNLFLGSVGFVYDTRFNPVESAQGTYLSMHYRQAFGNYSYSRGDIDFRHHRLIYQRPDTSGRHILTYKTKLGFSGSSPVFENYIAGGFSSLRGFEFRGVSPIQGGVRVGGEFQWLNSLEYDFPLTADDMLHAVVFTDFGTVEEEIQLTAGDFRVAPGLGLRVHLPFAGLAAPLAFDFAYPVASATGDEEQTFSFYVGLLR